MKNYLFLTLALLCFVLTGCGYQSHVVPLEGNPNYVSFTTVDDNGAVLTGVRNAVTNQVVISPDKYETITADEYVIVCEDSVKMTSAFTLEGEKIGRFEMFTPWQKKYYLGVNYLSKTYYFPKVKEIVNTKEVLQELDWLFIKTDEGWDLRSYEGYALLRLPERFWILKNEKIPNQIMVAKEKDDLKGCLLYTPANKTSKLIKTKQWREIKKKLRMVNQRSETVTVCFVDDFEKL